VLVGNQHFGAWGARGCERRQRGDQGPHLGTHAWVACVRVHVGVYMCLRVCAVPRASQAAHEPELSDDSLCHKDACLHSRQRAGRLKPCGQHIMLYLPLRKEGYEQKGLQGQSFLLAML